MLLSRTRIPSYKQGYALSPSMSIAPELWPYGGAWIPNLGSTGLTLFDVTRKNNGTLRDIDPDTDWFLSDGITVLDFDGVAAVVDLGTDIAAGNSLLSGFTVTTKLNWPSIASGYMVSRRDGNQPAWGYWIDQTNDLVRVIGGSTNTIHDSTATVPIGVPTVITCTWVDTTASIYIDGQFDSSGDITAIPTKPTIPVAIGTRWQSHPTTSFEINAKFHAVMIHNRVLSLREIKILHNDILLPLRLKPQVISLGTTEAPEGLFIPIAMHHYKQLMGAN